MVFFPGGLLSGVGIFSGLLSRGLLSVIPPDNGHGCDFIILSNLSNAAMQCIGQTTT